MCIIGLTFYVDLLHCYIKKEGFATKIWLCYTFLIQLICVFIEHYCMEINHIDIIMIFLFRSRYIRALKKPPIPS